MRILTSKTQSPLAYESREMFESLIGTMVPVRRASNGARQDSGGFFVRSHVAITFSVFTVLIVLTSVGSSVYFGTQCQSSNSADVVVNELPPPAWEYPPVVNGTSTSSEDVRLPRSIFPLIYTIRLLPWIEEGNFTIDGYVHILFNCVEATNMIVLHCVDIQIDEPSVKVHNNNVNNSMMDFIITMLKLCLSAGG